MSEKLPVAILGATTILGQQLIHLLAEHPWFTVAAVLGPPELDGNKYHSCPWYIDSDMPDNVKELTLLPYKSRLDQPLIISALSEELAREYETRFARQGHAIISSSAAFRMNSYTPLIVPEISADQLELIPKQKEEQVWPGFIVSLPSPATTSLSLPLRILQEEFGLKSVIATTMQGITDDSYQTTAAAQISDNIIPYPESEDILLELEPTKLLGYLQNGRLRLASILISAQSNRVNISTGHHISVSVDLANSPQISEVIELFETWAPPKICATLPSSPSWPIIYRYEQDRPQPRIDKQAEKGMAWTVGHLRRCGVFQLRFVISTNNLIRSGAGNAIQVAELLKQKELI